MPNRITQALEALKSIHDLLQGRISDGPSLKAASIAHRAIAALSSAAPSSAKPEGRCVRFTEPCECAPEAKQGCVTWRPATRPAALSNARIMELWAVADHPCDDNDHTTGPVPFARLIEKELLAAPPAPQAASEPASVAGLSGDAEREAPTDEQIADAIESAFSATGEWPEGDAAIVRAWIKYGNTKGGV